MKDSELQFDRTCHVLYSRPCKKQIQSKIALHFPPDARESVWECVQRQYVAFLSDWRTDLGGKKNFHNGKGGTYDCIEETLTYCDFPSEHWTRIRTNNVIERLNREIRRRTRVVGTFPDGNSALMLVCARLRHVAGTQWGCKKYMNMKHLEVIEQDLLVG